MIGKYKRSLMCGFKLLKLLEKNPKNLKLLFEIQCLVRNKVCYIEKRIQSLRLRLPIVNHKDKKWIEAKLIDYNWLLYLFRTICDGVVFIYYNKWDIKSLFYDTEFKLKPDSGYISGKTGSKLEFTILKKIIKCGLPAILCDLTNVIRYGDICVPIRKGTPSCIEVKRINKGSIICPPSFQEFLYAINPSSLDYFKPTSFLDERAQKQVKNLFAIDEYLFHDISHQMKRLRINIYAKESNYIVNINKLIKSASVKGIASTCVEEGVFYLVVFKNSIKSKKTTECLKKFLKKSNSNIVASILPDIKEWGMYYPFTLSIFEPQFVFDFINGEFTIFIFIQSKVLIKHFSARGYIAKIKRRSAYPIILIKHVNSASNPAIEKVSSSFFNRIFYEFISPYWLINEIINRKKYFQKWIKYKSNDFKGLD